MVVSCENFNADNIEFGEPRNVKMSFGNYKIVPIFYVQEGKEEKLVMITDKCFSWGVQEDKLSDSLKLPIVLVNKDVETSTLNLLPFKRPFWTLHVKLWRSVRRTVWQKKRPLVVLTWSEGI